MLVWIRLYAIIITEPTLNGVKGVGLFTHTQPYSKPHSLNSVYTLLRYSWVKSSGLQQNLMQFC